MTDKTELKPCPMCGSKPYRLVLGNLKCIGCDCGFVCPSSKWNDIPSLTPEQEKICKAVGRFSEGFDVVVAPIEETHVHADERQLNIMVIRRPVPKVGEPSCGDSNRECHWKKGDHLYTTGCGNKWTRTGTYTYCPDCGEPIYNLVGTPTDLAKAIREEAEEQILGDLYEENINSDYHLKITLSVLEVRRLIEQLTIKED